MNRRRSNTAALLEYFKAAFPPAPSLSPANYGTVAPAAAVTPLFRRPIEVDIVTAALSAAVVALRAEPASTPLALWCASLCAGFAATPGWAANSRMLSSSERAAATEVFDRIGTAVGDAAPFAATRAAFGV